MSDYVILYWFYTKQNLYCSFNNFFFDYEKPIYGLILTHELIVIMHLINVQFCINAFIKLEKLTALLPQLQLFSETTLFFLHK